MIFAKSISDLDKWDKRFIRLAEHVAVWSKGPRKRVGCVIVRPGNEIASTGYNGAPRGFDDELFLQLSRENQHAIVIHAEANALYRLNASDAKRMTKEPYTAYVSPMAPCANCARLLCLYGVRRVVAYCGQMSPDWIESAEKARQIFEQAGVEVIFVRAEQ